MKASFVLKAIVAIFALAQSQQATSATFSVSATTGCDIKLGSATQGADNGFKNNTTGSYVIACSIPRPSSSNVTEVRARTRNASSSGAQSFCSLTAFSTTGGNESDGATTWMPTTVGVADLAISLPSAQYTNGYIDLWCVIAPNDTFYGFRYTN